jgi:hypothetical protein
MLWGCVVRNRTESVCTATPPIENGSSGIHRRRESDRHDETGSTRLGSGVVTHSASSILYPPQIKSWSLSAEAFISQNISFEFKNIVEKNGTLFGSLRVRGLSAPLLRVGLRIELSSLERSERTASPRRTSRQFSTKSARSNPTWSDSSRTSGGPRPPAIGADHTLKSPPRDVPPWTPSASSSSPRTPR